MSENFSTGQLFSYSENSRTLRYKLTPWNEKAIDRDVSFTRGSIDYSRAEGAIVNAEHNGLQPAGKMSAIEDREDGLYVTVKLSDTTLGRDLFTEAKDGLRTGISMELDPTTYSVSNGFGQGVLTGAGLCVNPALGSARLMTAFSEDAVQPEEPEELTSEEEPEEEETPTEVPVTEDETPTESESSVTENPAATPQAAFTAQTVLSADVMAQNWNDKSFFNKLAEQTDGNNLFAALSGITGSANVAKIETSQFLGELWGRVGYTRKYANLVTHETLNSYKITGWRFVGDFHPAAYAGDLADIPTDTITTEPVEELASRLAHGFAYDRRYKDFGNTDFLQGAFDLQAKAYAKVTDAMVLTRLQNDATSIPASALGAVPAGVPKALVRIVDNAYNILKNTDQLPTFAIVAADLHREMLFTKDIDSLKYIETSLGLESGAAAGLTIIPSFDVPNGTVIVGHKSALRFFELPGETPIRVDGETLGKGQIEEAIFGYVGFITDNAKAIVKSVN